MTVALHVEFLGPGDRAVVRNAEPGSQVHWHGLDDVDPHDGVNLAPVTEYSTKLRTRVLEAPAIPMPPPQTVVDCDAAVAWLFVWPGAYGLVWIRRDGR